MSESLADRLAAIEARYADDLRTLREHPILVTDQHAEADEWRDLATIRTLLAALRRAVEGLARIQHHTYATDEVVQIAKGTLTDLARLLGEGERG